jgi:RNA polymerase sigma-70 factor, ECF subfamily
MTITSPTTDAAEFERELETHRRALTGYCYRMLAAHSEAEDAVQETLVRAWRGAGAFRGQSSVRSWLYRIATNVCIDMHRSPQRRARPMALGPAIPVAHAQASDPQPEQVFVQPVPDALVLDVRGDPADVAAARESIRLAFVAALQFLPPRQRAALVLCDVLSWPAVDAATVLDSSVASVNSALQRARATMAARRDEPLDPTNDPRQRATISRYVDAFERYDIDALVRLLRDDVVMSMPPYPMWLRGASDLVGWLLGGGACCRGSRLVAVDVNGTAGFGSYRSAGPGRWEPWAVQLIEVADGLIVGHHNFLYPEHFAAFGLPPFLEV